MHKNLLIKFLIGLFTVTMLNAQTETENIIHEQGFSEPGFPVGWTTNDLSGQNVIWSWCGDPTTGQTDGCPRIWEGGFNNQSPFAASSAENGFLTLDSDLSFGISQPHISQLTSPSFDFSTEDTVWVEFQTHLGVFNITPNNNALLRVSNNGGATWQIFNCFPEFPLEVGAPEFRWSANPETIFFNVSEIAANQSSVTFQWQWIGQAEYQWSIDDLKISNSDPRPDVDLELKDKAFLIPENSIIPSFEISPISFGATIINQGSQPQIDAKLAITIFNSNNNVVYTDTLVLPTITVDQETDLLVFPNSFTPSSTTDSYEGVYNLIPNNPDANPEDNLQNFTFEIGENIIAKEHQLVPRRSTAPLDNEWSPVEPHSWAWGNYYFIKNGVGKLATAATFSIANAEILGGRSVNLTLFEWSDLDDNKMAETNERSLVAFGEYDILGSEPGDGFITIPLLSFTGNAALKDNQGYLLMLEYFAEDPLDLFINFSDEQDYETTLNYLESSGTTRFASMLGIGNPLSDVPYSSLAFGFDKIPMVRLEMEEIVGIQNLLPENFQVSISPNPTVDNIEVSFDFPEMIPSVGLNLFSNSGKLLISKNLSEIQHDRSIISGNQLTPGIYFLEVKTKIGNRTLKVVKVN